ncbi:hypothetical protein [Actinocorallia longicatena]|uniref:Uncharacterized protein n=1 Tax=Actinocorallia longicatena TaxID=111803 RepID=A0ABP6QCZ4_9ACTN
MESVSSPIGTARILAGPTEIPGNQVTEFRPVPRVILKDLTQELPGGSYATYAPCPVTATVAFVDLDLSACTTPAGLTELSGTGTWTFTAL